MAFGVMTNNAKNNSKYKIRLDLLSIVSGDKKVLDIFCGSGDMYHKVWHTVDEYKGIDIKNQNDERDTVCSDSIVALENIIDVNNYNIFDIDAYGSPYQELGIILDKCDGRHNEYIFILTDGLEINMKFSRVAKSVKSFFDINNNHIVNFHRLHKHLIRKAIKKIEDALPTHQLQKTFITKGNKGTGMYYYGIYLKKKII